MITHGDSGGPDFINLKLTGIHSGGSDDCSLGFSISIPATHDMLQAIMATQWNPSAVTQFLDIFGAEIAGIRWNFNDTNTVNWAQAARAANTMCYNRGFTTGHFTGYQVLNESKYGLQCSGGGSVWYDATAAEIASITTQSRRRLTRQASVFDVQGRQHGCVVDNTVPAATPVRHSGSAWG